MIKNATDVIEQGYNAVIQYGKTYKIVAGEKKKLLLNDEDGKPSTMSVEEAKPFLTII